MRGAVLCDTGIFFSILLIVKCDGNAFSSAKLREGGCVWNCLHETFLVSAEEAEVFQAEEFGFLFFLFGCGGVFTRAHCKEEGPNEELAHCLVEVIRFVFSHIFPHNEGEA